MTEASSTPVWNASRRIYFLFLSGAVIALVLILRSIWFAADIHGNGNQSSILQTIYISGVRGKILAQDGTVLAWSERCLRLTWSLSNQPHDSLEQQYFQLKQLFAVHHLDFPFKTQDGTSMTLQQLEAEFAKKDSIQCHLPLKSYTLRDALPSNCSLDGTFIRHKINDTALSAQIGTTTIPDTGPTALPETGISGLEKKYDDLLRPKIIPVSFTEDSNSILVPEDFDANGKDIIVSVVPSAHSSSPDILP